ncbi:MAG TPA: hypothetical protein VJ276_11495 [Thermoanaerobaculia bacterium]|nr:hypothetical protein [Thermoanaerobaculia bacterium]
MIDRYSRYLVTIEAISAATAIAIIAWFNLPVHRSVEISKVQAALLPLPWLLFFASFTPLAHSYSARRLTSKTARRILACCSMAFTAAWLFIFGAIYGHFIFSAF